MQLARFGRNVRARYLAPREFLAKPAVFLSEAAVPAFHLQQPAAAHLVLTGAKTAGRGSL